MKGYVCIAAIALAARVAAGDAASALTFASGTERVTLLELYTSEGCSSCPPADRWLSQLSDAPDLWRRWVPIAFHVDYWDYIGWKDRFSSAGFSDRQRRYAQQGGARAVYTPGFFSNGQEWQQWRSVRAPAVDAVAVGELRIEASAAGVTATFAPHDTLAAPLAVHLAVLGMDLDTRVNAGENRGRTLRHDFVALGVTSMPLVHDGEAWQATLTWPDTSVDAERHALAAWVTRGARQAPVQAVGGLLPAGFANDNLAADLPASARGP